MVRTTLLVAAFVLLAVGAPPAAAQLPTGPCGGLLQPPCPPPPPPEPPAPEPKPPPTPPAPGEPQPSTTRAVTLSVTPRVAAVGQLLPPPRRIAVRVEGGLSGVGVDVMAFSLGYDDEPRQLLSGTTGRGGRFEGQANLLHNARVWAVIDDERSRGQSRDVETFLYPRAALGVAPPKRGRVRFDFSLRSFGGATKNGSARTSFFYQRQPGSKYFVRFGSAPLARGQCLVQTCTRRASLSARVTLTLERATRFLACARGLGFVGLGLPDTSCGARRVR